MASPTWSQVLLAALAITAGAGCNAISDAVSVDATELLELSTSATSAPADGAYLVTVTATIPEGTDSAHRTVHFTTTAGTIVGSTASSQRELDVIADLSGHAVVHVQAPAQVGAATVTAAKEGLARSFVLAFEAALPTRIDVDPQELELNVRTGDSADVLIYLRRGTGVASVGTPVELVAYDANGQPIGAFVEVTPSDATGKATANFQVDEGTRYRGSVRIVARVRDPATGAVIEGSAAVSLID